MRVKIEWLRELVDLSGISTEEIIKKMGLYSIEIENVEYVVSGTNLVVGHVLEKEKHPDSDHLSVCKVDVGTEILQIVCGAPNVDKDQYVICALVGAELPNNIKIKKSKIRGIESSGMLCSLNELGMEHKFIPEKYQNGIYIFEKEVTPGSDALLALNFKDEVMELGITPNRGDLMSMLGVAYDASSVFNRPLKPLAYKVIEEEEKTTDNVSVEIADDTCKVYYAKCFKDLQIKESPDWLTSRLIAFGVRPINNVVDITNYILALFGQPLHAFDSDKLGKTIKVRKALENEEIVTLDEVKRNLKSTDTVITDGQKPVAIAGVMGGYDTEITPETKNLTLEVAVFDSLAIRLTSTRLNLRSESSMRYERGVDINRCKMALEYASYLLQTLANAKVLKGEAVKGNTKIADTVIEIDDKYVSKVLGIKITKHEIIQILESLGFKVEDKETLFVSVPNRRPDVKIRADLVEEIARIHGYDKLPTTLPSSSLQGGYTTSQTRIKTLRHALLGLGLDERITYTLQSNQLNETFTLNHIEGSEAIYLMYPISSERKYLRQGLVASLLETVEYAFARKIKDIASFEIGKVYYYLGEENKEERVLSIAMANSFSNTLWNGKNEEVDFYLIKGIIDAALKSLNVNLQYKPLDRECKELHPNRTAIIMYDNEEIGFVGELHPKYAQEHDLKDVYVAEIKLEKILNIKPEIVKYQPISKVPSVERDLALVVKKDVLASSIIETIKNTDKKALSNVKIFDLYIGDKVKDDEKSIAIKLTFTSNETLTDEMVNNKINKILKELAKAYDAKLRA